MPHTDPLGPVSSALNKYKFIDIGSSNCRQWCAAVIHCLAYKVTSGSDCYIYDSQVNEIPYGADSYTSGTRTLVSTVYTGSGDTLYYPDRTVAYASEVPTLDDLGWVRLHAGVTAYSSEYGEVNHYRIDGNHEFECLEMCAYIATCISAVHVNGNCIVFDSAATELPTGASLYQNGSFSVSFMLAQTAMIGAVTFAPPSVVANETCLDDWLSSSSTDGYGSESSALNKYKFIDIGSSNCRQWCAANSHCIAYKVTSGSDCYIYDSQVNEIPYGADSYTSGTRTLVSTVYTGSGDTFYYPELGTNSTCANTGHEGSVSPDQFMADWVAFYGFQPVDSFGTVLKSYVIYDITGEECRQACIDAVHCLAYATYNSGTPDCYIYDSQVTSTPSGADAYYTGPTTLVDYKSSTSYTTYGANRTAVSSTVQSFLDSQGWVRYLDGVIPYSSDLTYVTSYIYLGRYEDECVEQCAAIATCIALVYREGNCYIYDSSASEAPVGATSFSAGASEISYMLGIGGTVRGAVSFSAPLDSLDDSFMADWITVENARPVDSFDTVLQYYYIMDISHENCRQWCLAASHCLAYAIYEQSNDDCYIYDSQVSSGSSSNAPAGAYNSYVYAGGNTLVSYQYTTTAITTYGANRTAVSSTVQSFLDSQGWVRYLDGVIPYSSDLTYVTSYIYLGRYEDECVEQCAAIATCIALVYREGNCYIYDSSASEAPVGATSFSAGASEISYMLGIGGTVRGAVSFSAPLDSLDDSFMADWITVENARPVDSFDTVLQYYYIMDISHENCRQWCLAASHCLAYAIYEQSNDDCYIYDSQVSSGSSSNAPAGAYNSYVYAGGNTLVSYQYTTTAITTYGANRTAVSSTVQSFLDSQGWVRYLDGVIPYSSDLTYVTSYIYLGRYEDECVEQCAAIASCIALVYREGNCYIYDSSASEAPVGATSFSAGASEISYMLGIGGTVRGAVSFSAPLDSLDDSFMADWITVENARPVDSFDTILQYYYISDISHENCRQWCLAASHCLAYAIYEQSNDDCYIYDSQVSSGSSSNAPAGAYNSYVYPGGNTLVSYQYTTTAITTYGANRTAVSSTVQSFLDSQGWVRYLDGVIPYSSDLTYVTSYIYLGRYEDECVEQCAAIASCIALVYREGNCYIYDSSASEAPVGATSFSAGASEISYMLGIGGTVRGAVSFSAPLDSLDDSFMADWITVENARPVDSFDTVLQYYYIMDISHENCRQWCLAASHCLAYAIYEQSNDDCYIYDSQVSSGSSSNAPAGAYNSYVYPGGNTLVSYQYTTTAITTYGANRTAVSSTVQSFLDSQGWVRYLDGVIPYSSDLTYVTSYIYLGRYEDECVEQCAAIATCIALVYREGNCYIYDSSASEAPVGATSFSAGASEISYMLGIGGTVRGAVSFSAPLDSLDDSFMADWITVENARPVDSFDTVLQYYYIMDISHENCRQWCLAASHCLAYAIYEQSNDDCYIYDSQVSSGSSSNAPAGAYNSYVYAGGNTLVSYQYTTTAFTTYGSDPGNI